MVVRWRCFGRVHPLSSSCAHTKNGFIQLERSVTGIAGDVQKPGIPLVPKHRDPNAVLKALAATVDVPDKPFFMGRSNLDPFAPRNRRNMIDLVIAKEAGKTAGEYIVNRYPKLFPGRQPKPDLRPWRASWKGLNEETLKDFIKARKVSKTKEVYKELLEKGETVSLETRNQLLALLAYLGTNGDEKISLEITRERTEESDREDFVSKNIDESKPLRRKLPRLSISWSLENDAEKMFAEMTDKDGITYSAIIQGLARYGEFNRALELFEEARKNDFQVTLTTYNSLLSAMIDSRASNQWKKAKNIVSNMTSSDSSPIVKPNTATINLLLLFARGTGMESRQNAIETMREMTHLRLKPSLTTFLRLLDCFMTSRDYLILYPIVDYMEEHSSEVLNITEYSDVDFFSYAMLGTRYLRDISLTKRINNLAKKDCYYLVGTLESFLSHYLFLSSFQMDINKLVQEYQTVVPHLFVPKEWVYQVLFKKCESEGRPDIAVTLWQDMMRNRVYIDKIDVISRLMGSFTKSINCEDIDKYVTVVEDVWKKLIYMSEKPTPLILSMTIKVLTLNNQLEDAWKCFDLFYKFDTKPTYLAVHALLKVHQHMGDTETVMNILEIMVHNELFLSLSYVRNLCHFLEIPKEKKVYFLQEFEKIRPSPTTSSNFEY